MTRPHELRLYAHRGSSAALPENTLEAFGQALADGANALETDVHRTRDGRWVVCHDPDGRRTAGRPERIADVDLAQVERWDVGRGLKIPTLEALLGAFPGVPVSVDLKPAAPSRVRSIIDLLERLGAEHRVTLASFHPRVLAAVRRLGWPGRTALGQLEVAALRFLPAGFARVLVRGHAAQVPRASGAIRLDGPRFIARCHRLGLRVDYWTVNDPEIARSLIARGATGIMSDDPALMADLFAAPR